MNRRNLLIISAIFQLTTSGLVTLLDSRGHHATKSAHNQQSHSVKSTLPKGLGWQVFNHPDVFNLNNLDPES